jgi:hypothetical protein
LILPEQALEAILLLHNAMPNQTPYTNLRNIPHHRLLDFLGGIMSTNAFSDKDRGKMGLLQLTGSLFNHDANHNVTRRWNETTEQLVFTTLRDVKAGE